MRAAILVCVAACSGASSSRLPGEPVDDSPSKRSGDMPCAGDTDGDGDGVVDLHWLYDYDDRGRSTRDVGRYVAGGADATVVYEWDNVDHLTRMVTTNDFSLVREDYTATYDTLGDLVVWEIVDDYGDNGGEWSYRVAYAAFDDFGHPARAMTAMTGTADSTTVFMYDDLGRVIERDRDDNNDGTIDSRASVAYDENAMTSTTTTANADGTRSILIRTYDAAAHLLAMHRDSFGVDGALTHTFDYTYDWNGDRYVGDSYSYDGVLGMTDTYRYDCPRSRRLQRIAASRTTVR